MSTALRNLLIVVFVLLVVLAGVTWYLLANPQFSGFPITITTPGSSPIAKTSLPPDRSLHVIEHAKYYDVDMQYPASTPLSSSSNDNAIQAMKVFSQNTIASFKDNGNFANLTPHDITMQGLDQGQKYALSDSYKAYLGTHTVSYVFTIYQDTLGAHPNTYFRTFAFNLESGQSLLLSDLFQPTANYLDTLSSLTRAALAKQQGSGANATDFINPGTTPNADNFQNFAVDGSNLVIFFPPYQVASYAQGPQTVKIPLSQLSSLLQAAYK
jgi:hypothetical protein